MRTFIAILACIGLAASAELRSKIRARRADVFSLSFGSPGTSCTDAKSDCSQYDKSMCTDAKYQQWVQDNCCAYCQSGGSPVPSVPNVPNTGSSSCTDKIANCADYTQSVCTNADYAQWVSENCPKFCNKCSGGTVFQPATFSPIAPVISSGGATCTDKQANCADYGQAVCTDTQYTQWVKDNCQKFCGICTGSSGSVPMTGNTGMTGGSTSCTDVSSNCAVLNQASHICSDAGAKVYAQQNCAMTCNMCPTGGSSPMVSSGGSSTCTNKLSNCDLYGKTMCSNADYATWAKENCAQYCGLCSSSGSSSGSVPMPSSGGSGSAPVPSSGGSGSTFTGSSSAGCYYKSQLHAQDAKWNDGCDYECTCVDGSSGRYSCNAMCVTWNLPSACNMNPPAAGKCCPTPSCPTGYQIKYPDNYVPK